MSTFDSQPENNNFLSPLGFRFIISKLPLVNFYCQSASLPSVSLQENEIPNPLVRIPLAGTKLTFAPLDIRFRVDEDMKNYLEIYNWMEGLGTPVDTEQYEDLNKSAAGSQPSLTKSKMGPVMQGVFSDATLVVLTSSQNANMRIKFVDTYPINISPIQFDVTGSDVAYVEADVTLNYRSFTVESL